MTPFLRLFSSSPYIETLQGLIGWAGFIVLIGVVGLLLWKWRKYNKPFGKRQIGIFLTLLVLEVATTAFIGIRLPVSMTSPPLGLPEDPLGPAVMIFSAVPWVLAAGMLGPSSAVVLAVVSGVIYTLGAVHNPFTPLEFAFLAVLFSVAVRQHYRTTAFRLIRHPLITAMLLTMFFPFIHLIISTFTSQGIFVSRLDYALTNLEGVTLAMGIMLFVAGLFAEGIYLLAPKAWGENTPLVPSPAEKSLQTRFMVSMAPLAFALVLTLMVGDWIVAGQAARSMLQERMSNAAQTAAQNVPYFLETGQNLIVELGSDPRLLSGDQNTIQSILAQDIKSVPFFNQLSVIDASKDVIATYPTSNYIGPQAPVDEQMGIQSALNGLPFQTFIVPPASNQTTAQVSFVAALFDKDLQAKGVLVGRSDLASNPFTQPLLLSLTDLSGVEGTGILIDENKRILFDPDPTHVMNAYTGPTPETPTFFDDTAPNGTRQLTLFQPAEGRPWSVVLSVPAYRAQQLALQIAAPLLAMIMVLSLIAIILMRLSLRVVTGSLQNLAGAAGRLAQGKLDEPLPAQGEDEVGQLRRAFEQMRVSLKARLDELNRLLLVSQGVASSLEMSEAVQPVLEAGLATGASAARVVLTPAVVPGLEEDASVPVSFGLGKSQALYCEADDQILAFTRQQDRLVLSNLSRPRLLNFAPGAARPESLMAVALRHENLFYGALWVAYDVPHSFSEEEVRFIVTLGSQAALAAANAHLFQNAEIGRQRLAAILASSPDPVLVINQQDRLSLANPAAWQVLDLSTEACEGQPIQQVISQTELLDLLLSTSDEKQSKEIALTDGCVYLATATPVISEGQRVGRVCVLRDVTHFKELDALKSEFVSTVSHDLRSPLTLMRGYATMLEMVGQLNEQQTSYVRKIVTGVESMSRLVNNLLDLGRIEAGIGLQLEMISVQDVVERVVGALQLQAAQKRIQLSTEFPPQAVPLIEADQALLQQALHNLVENAIKYTRSEGKILVRIQVQHQGVVFDVMDNGIGVSPMDLPRLFEKFYRGAQQVSKDQRGTGLGLAIVKSIAERHGGRVWAESQLGKGSVFHLAIPVRQPRPERVA